MKPRLGAIGAALALLGLSLAALPVTGHARATAARYPVQYCQRIPFIQGVPPWGFHANDAITGANGSYARGHGDIDLVTRTVSGVMCQVDRVHGDDRLLYMTVEHHLDYQSHHALKWGVPGNIMTVTVKVTSSTDPRCQVGTVGHATIFASYNNVRSDSAGFRFPGSCRRHDHVYHGGNSVNAQVPPL